MFESIPFIRFVTLREKVFLTRQLATMLGSGVPLTQSMSTLLAQTKNPELREILEAILTDLETGHSFSSAIAKHPKVFDKVYVAVTRAGEISGRLEEVLEELANRLEDDQNFSTKLKNALVYPVFIILAMIVVTFLMMIYVIPRLKEVFEESNAQLPWATRALIATSGFVSQYWYLVILAIIAIVFALRFYLQTEEGGWVYDRFRITVPIFGPLAKEIYMARFTRTLGMLMKSGIPIIEALNIVGDVIGNRIYAVSLQDTVAQIERGIPMSVPLEKNPDFPVIVSQMVLVGEQTGRMDTILHKLSTFYEAEVNSKIKGISSLIEPMVLVIIGVGVGILVFAVIQPIYTIAQIQ